MTGKQMAAVAIGLLDRPTIPYTSNGSSLSGMDCQGLIEYCMMKCGISRNWSGSNKMWRVALSWQGTPEECVKKFGCVPVGAGIFIVSDDGGEKARGYNDNEGNAEHVGIKVAKGKAVHASSSRGCVAESVFNDKTIQNGGWNMVGLWADDDYSEQMGSTGTVSSTGSTTQEAQADKAPAAGSASTAYNPRYTHLVVKNGTKGGAVREVQQGLKLCGYDVACDGEFEPLTLEAVKAFQQARGLEADGIVGRMTWAELIAAAREETK